LKNIIISSIMQAIFIIFYTIHINIKKGTRMASIPVPFVCTLTNVF